MKTQPIWKTVPIEVSADGQVRFLGKSVPTRVSNARYHSVGLLVHRLVAAAFHGLPASADMVVDHIDRNTFNNAASNLRWLTQAENTRRGFDKRFRRLSDAQVAEILALKPKGDTTTISALAESFGVTAGTARAIRSGRLHSSGFSKTNRTVLTETQVQAIRDWRPNKTTAASVARSYQVSPGTILNIWHGIY